MIHNSQPLNERIRELRKKAGYSQQQMARKLHLTQGAISQWENGITVPAADQLSALADVFEITVDELLGRAVEQPPEDEAWAIRERLRRDPAYRLLFDAADSEGRAFESRRAHQRNRWKQTLPAVFSCAWAR